MTPDQPPSKASPSAPSTPAPPGHTPAPSPPAQAAPDAPPALPTERTRLAWRRTTLSVTVVVLLAVSGVLVRGVTALALACVALMAGTWLAVLVLAHRRITALARGASPAVRRQPALVALLAAGLAMLGCLLVLGTSDG